MVIVTVMDTASECVNTALIVATSRHEQGEQFMVLSNSVAFAFAQCESTFNVHVNKHVITKKKPN